MDAEAVGAHESLAGNFHHDAPVDGFCHGTPALAAGASSSTRLSHGSDAQYRLDDSVRFDQGRDIAPEIIIRPVDAFAEHVAHKPRHFDWRADLALRVLDCLGNALVRIVDEGLIDQAYLLVEGLEP